MKEEQAIKWIKIFNTACGGADKSTEEVPKRIRHVPLQLRKDVEVPTN